MGLAEMFANGRKLRRLPVNRYNLRFFTKYPDCTFYKYFGHVLVTKEDVEGTVAVTVLDWNNDLKRCFY